MKALVLEATHQLALRDIVIDEPIGPRDVRIKVRSVGICGSDVHYYQHGKIGPFVVREPMVLGHEAAGTVVEVGHEVTSLSVGERVCMEPGVPDFESRATLLGMYNLDPAVRFWATPPVHGCLRETVVHPSQFVFKLPPTVSYEEGALCEPLSVGLQAVSKAGILPGDIALVTGCGTIGLVTAMSALAAGCSKVVVTDVLDEKLAMISRVGAIPVNARTDDLVSVIKEITDGWGVDVVFEASGSEGALGSVFAPLRPGGTVVLVGMPPEPMALDIVAAQAKEARIETVFRYANTYPRALALLESKKIDVKGLVTDRFDFKDSVEAFEYAADPRPETVKIMIDMSVA